MLTSGNVGKYASGEWHRKHASALVDSTSLSDDEKTYLDITTEGTNPPERYRVDTNPIDQNTFPSFDAVDIRNLPLAGGKQ